MASPPKNPAYLRYTKRMVPLSVFYVAAIALATRLVPDNAPASATTVALALLPGFAVLGWIWAMGASGMPREKDCFHSKPSRQTVTSRMSDRALTTETPTPCRPPEVS